jgi:hypothetical protein
MTRVAIFPSNLNGAEYLAVAGDKKSVGKTAGQALDALAQQLSPDTAGTLVIVQSWQPDAFFSAAQQARLGELMTRWQAARDGASQLSTEEQAELESLVEVELRASELRTARVLADLGQ